MIYIPSLLMNMLRRARMGTGSEMVVAYSKTRYVTKAEFSVSSSPRTSDTLLPASSSEWPISGIDTNIQLLPPQYPQIPPLLSIFIVTHWSRPPLSRAWSPATVALLSPCLQVCFSHSIFHQSPPGCSFPWPPALSPNTFPIIVFSSMSRT